VEQAAARTQPIHRIFSIPETVGLMMRIEAALAAVQARRGIIPQDAADEIQAKSDPRFAPLEAIQAGLAQTNHPLLGILHAWSGQLSHHAAQWLHYGATTADIFNTVLILQLRSAATLMLEQMEGIEAVLVKLAHEHRATPMVGRTLGRHALPITFGMKLASWLAEHDRSIRRLRHWMRTYSTGILSGAVGTYAALGPDGPDIEAEVMAALGLSRPEAVDWKGSRDRYVEFASAVAIAARSYGRLAQEVFLLQGDDIAELNEASPGIGSSTMPHKSNPTLCIAIVSRCREVSAELPTLFEWMMTIYERDSSLHDASMQRLCKTFALVLDASAELAGRLQVHPDAMLANLNRTQGHILAESLTFQLSANMGKARAHDAMHRLLRHARRHGLSLRQALASQPELEAGLNLDADSLDPALQLGLAPQITDAALLAIAQRSTS